MCTLVSQVASQERYLDMLASQGEFTTMANAESSAAAKMHLQHLWGTVKFHKVWNPWREKFNQGTSVLPRVAELRQLTKGRIMGEVPFRANKKGKTDATDEARVEEETMDADGGDKLEDEVEVEDKVAEIDGEEEDMEQML